MYDEIFSQITNAANKRNLRDSTIHAYCTSVAHFLKYSMNISEYANRENDEPLVGLIFVGNSNSKIADELEADALRFGFEITDTIMDETHPIDMLKWYMKNTSIMAVLVRDILDISSDKERFKYIDAKYHVFVNRDKCDGLRESGMAMGEQTRPIDRTRIVKKIGAISDEALFDEIVRASEAIITDYK